MNIIPSGTSVRKILLGLKEEHGSVVMSADYLRILLHELHIRRKKMSEKKKK